mmetsp:Transcript_38249/g.63135  ORF Transcript_38249/g.63135 Transcript_38249/m.63135 type:complete len:80 (-) Transcript_38249:186-425(-)
MGLIPDPSFVATVHVWGYFSTLPLWWNWWDSPPAGAAAASDKPRQLLSHLAIQISYAHFKVRFKSMVLRVTEHCNGWGW